MNIQKFTQKSVEAVNNLEKTAMEYGNQEIEQEHLLYCLLTPGGEPDLQTDFQDGYRFYRCLRNRWSRH